MRYLKQRFALGASLVVLGISAAAAADNNSQPSPPAQTPSAQTASVPVAPLELAANDKVGVQLAANAIETVTVTARRREEDSQHVPIALSVIGSAQLDAPDRRFGAGDHRGVPSLQLFSTNPRNTSVKSSRPWQQYRARQ